MILLSFDTEEFDVPCEHGVNYDPIAEGMAVDVTTSTHSQRMSSHRKNVLKS